MFQENGGFARVWIDVVGFMEYQKGKKARVSHIPGGGIELCIPIDEVIEALGSGVVTVQRKEEERTVEMLYFDAKGLTDLEQGRTAWGFTEKMEETTGVPNIPFSWIRGYDPNNRGMAFVRKPSE